jgi:hypothetical protein
LSGESGGERHRHCEHSCRRVCVKDKTVWQYKLLTRNLAKEEVPSEEELNKIGNEGWELVGVFNDTPFVYFYFKRLKD